MRRALRRDRGDEGAAAVEFALVLIPFVLLVFGAIQFGIVFAQQLSLSNAARQGARLGVVTPNTCGDVVSQVQNAAGTIGLNGNNVQVQVQVASTGAPTISCAYTASTTSTTRPCLGSVSSSRLIVTAKFDSSLIIPFASNLQSIGLTGKGVYRCEYSN